MATDILQIKGDPNKQYKMVDILIQMGLEEKEAAMLIENNRVTVNNIVAGRLQRLKSGNLVRVVLTDDGSVIKECSLRFYGGTSATNAYKNPDNVRKNVNLDIDKIKKNLGGK